jgi:hypothetical protein
MVALAAGLIKVLEVLDFSLAVPAVATAIMVVAG